MTFWLGFVFGIFVAWAVLGLALTAWFIQAMTNKAGGKS